MPFFYKGFVPILSSLLTFIQYLEVLAIWDIRSSEVWLYNFTMWFNEKNWKLWGFPGFDFALYLKSETWNLRKISFASNFVFSIALIAWESSKFSLNFKFTETPCLLIQRNKDTIYKEIPIQSCFLLYDVNGFKRTFNRKTDILV